MDNRVKRYNLAVCLIQTTIELVLLELFEQRKPCGAGCLRTADVSIIVDNFFLSKTCLEFAHTRTDWELASFYTLTSLRVIKN